MEHKFYQGVYKKENTPLLLSWITSGSRVLECGTATGYMTKYLKENLNCRVTGIELSEEMAQYADPYAEQMIIANLDENGWEQKLTDKFDYIIFADVLEHLRNPYQVLNKALRFLSPEGKLITSIPNIAHNAIIMGLMSGEFNYQKYGLLDDTHIHFFTRKSIGHLMDSCGVVCLNEKNIILSPGATEFKKFYLQNPLKMLFLCWRRDAHVYQFVNSWGFKDVSGGSPKIKKRQPIWKLILILGDDLNAYLYCKFNYRFRLPLFIKKIIRK